ncbi:MAG TPA: hypothetical protein VG675_07990 [Bryobacteraceae bacterium]|nr:hypothetical protein [Bryobacteraceae bacterium]
MMPEESTLLPAESAPAPRKRRKTGLLYTGISLLMLVPCYWQPRLQAGDLSSHIYNAWLAKLIESGHAQGLVIVHQTTNILFDLLLSGLFQLVGPEAAQRIAVSLAVLTFIWGAFAFVCAVSRREPWHLLPCIAMLAYGWVFHMGFFNFYISLGLCFWALALLWRPRRKRVLAAAALLAVAYVAHALPVAWIACLLLYLLMARRVGRRNLGYLTACSVALAAGLRAVLSHTLVTQWSLRQIAVTTGADQVWVFGTKYYLVLMALLLVWGLLFIELVHDKGVKRLVFSLPFQLCMISAAGVFILPTTVLIPGFNSALAYVAERMSLGVGICVIALLGGARPRAWQRYGMLAVAAIFFLLVYRDEHALNQFEQQMDEVVAQLPPGQRVVSSIQDPDLRTNALTHMIDRACVGRCFSYANYEPSTAQFRIRAVKPNRLVVSRYADSWALQMGTYILKNRDVPIYKIDLDDSGRMVIRPLKAGTLCGSTFLQILPDLRPNS